MSTCAQPCTASIAAEPVSPLVAPTIVTRSPAGAEHVVEQPPDELQGDVLERQRRPVEQLGQPLPVVDLHQRHDGRVAERRRRPRRTSAARSAGAMSSPTNGAMMRRAASAYPLAASSSAGGGSSGHSAGTYRPPSVASPASSTSANPSSGARPRVETYAHGGSARR